MEATPPGVRSETDEVGALPGRLLRLSPLPKGSSAIALARRTAMAFRNAIDWFVMHHREELAAFRMRPPIVLSPSMAHGVKFDSGHSARFRAGPRRPSGKPARVAGLIPRLSSIRAEHVGGDRLGGPPWPSAPPLSRETTAVCAWSFAQADGDGNVPVALDYLVWLDDDVQVCESNR